MAKGWTPWPSYFFYEQVFGMAGLLVNGVFSGRQSGNRPANLALKISSHTYLHFYMASNPFFLNEVLIV
jgi:hypothetical protein